ncbi:phage terminase small subunit, partial [Escherichia coli]|uniref:phage terminase small subunit n=1 Tax=Escherichia coli TaxID=562 RepID=UPI00126D0B1F
PARGVGWGVAAGEACGGGGSVCHGGGEDVRLRRLAEGRRGLRVVEGTVKRAERKVEVLPKYGAWAGGVLAAGGAQQDDGLMYV